MIVVTANDSAAAVTIWHVDVLIKIITECKKVIKVNFNNNYVHRFRLIESFVTEMVDIDLYSN